MIVVGAALALVVSILSVFFIQRAVYRRFFMVGLSYELDMSKKSAFEGDKFVMTETLTNRKNLPLPWVHVSYRMPSDLVFLNNVNTRIPRWEIRNLMFVIGRHKTLRRRTDVLCAKRGYYVIDEMRMGGSDPLMTDFKGYKLDQSYAVTVYPLVKDFPEARVPLRNLTGDIIARRFINPDPFTFKGIREYQYTDSLKQVNFKATAKTGELMSNVYDFTVSRDVCIVLNLRSHFWVNRDDVREEAIRLAAHIGRTCVEAGIPVSLLGPKSRAAGSGSSLAHLEGIYSALAHIDLVKGDNTLLLPLMDDIDPARTACVLVSSYHGEDMLTKYRELRDKGCETLWFIPLFSDEELEIPVGEFDEGMIKLEVCRNEQTE